MRLNTQFLSHSAFLCAFYQMLLFFMQSFVPPLLSGQIIFPFSPLSDPVH